MTRSALFVAMCVVVGVPALAGMQRQHRIASAAGPESGENLWLSRSFAASGVTTTSFNFGQNSFLQEWDVDNDGTVDELRVVGQLHGGDVGFDVNLVFRPSSWVPTQWKAYKPQSTLTGLAGTALEGRSFKVSSPLGNSEPLWFTNGRFYHSGEFALQVGQNREAGIAFTVVPSPASLGLGMCGILVVMAMRRM